MPTSDPDAVHGAGTKSFRLAALVPATSLLVAAYDQAAIGVVLEAVKTRWHLGSFEVGALASLAVVGMIAGGTAAGVLGDRFGRAAVLLADLLLFFGAAAASAFSIDPAMLLACRFLVGVGIGADYTVALVYLAEVAPSRLRGTWMAASLFGANFGMLAAYGAGALLLRYGEGWRVVLGLGALGALPVVWSRRGIEETAAFSEAKPLRVAVLIRHAMSRRNLRRYLGPMAAWFSYQVGDQGISLYLPLILAGILSSDAARASAAALAVKAITIPASFATIFLVERVGRRRLQICGFALRATSFAVVAGLLLVMGSTEPLLLTALLAIGIAAGSAGPDKTTPMVPAEAPGHRTRATGQGMAQGAGRLGGVVGLTGYALFSGPFGPGAGVAWLAAFAAMGTLVSLAIPDSGGPLYGEDIAEEELDAAS
jgi:MFS family permease